jgi:hypothetical protein
MMSANINDYALMPLKTVEAALADFDWNQWELNDILHGHARPHYVVVER